MGAVLLTAAVFVATGNSEASWKTAAIALVLLGINAVVAHPTGRAFHRTALFGWAAGGGDAGSTHELLRSALHGVLATLLALALAHTSILRQRIPRILRIGPGMETRLLLLLRQLQSRHPGDYMLWLTVGVAVFCSAAAWMLR